MPNRTHKPIWYVVVTFDGIFGYTSRPDVNDTVYAGPFNIDEASDTVEALEAYEEVKA